RRQGTGSPLGSPLDPVDDSAEVLEHRHALAGNLRLPPPGYVWGEHGDPLAGRGHQLLLDLSRFALTRSFEHLDDEVVALDVELARDVAPPPARHLVGILQALDAPRRLVLDRIREVGDVRVITFPDSERTTVVVNEHAVVAVTDEIGVQLGNGK